MMDRRKLVARSTALLIFVCLFLSACRADEPPAGQEVYPLQADFADEELLRGGDYHEFIAEESEYTVKLMFRAKEVLTDVRFALLEYDEEAALRPAEELYTLSELTPGQPFVAGVVFYGDLTTYGISFTDADGQAHRCAVYISGKDGSLLMQEYEA